MTDLSQLTDAFGTLATATQAALAAVASRADGLVNPRNYGDVGSGNDTPAVQGAINSQAGAVLIDRTYDVGPLTCPPGTVLQGVNGQAYYNATPTVPSLAMLSRLRLLPGSTGPLISPNDTGAQKATAVRINDINLDCNGITQPAINLPDQAGSISRFWRMNRVYVNNIGGATGYGIYIGNQNTACTMRDCVIFNGTSGSAAGHHGVGWYGSDGLMDNCFIGYFGGTGLNILGGASDETFTIHGGGVFTCTTGIVVGGQGAVIDGVSIDHNYNDGIYIGFGPTFITGCTFHSNSRTTNNTWSNIAINAAVQVAVSGCRAAPRDGETTNNPKYMIATHGIAGITLDQFGNFLEPGAVLGTGWTDYAG